MTRFRSVLALLAVAACAALPLRPAVAGETAKPVIVTLDTNVGKIVLALDPQRAPRTVANFVHYVRDGFYRGTIFHRVIPGFMIQGGGYTKDLTEKPTRDPIPIESNNGLKNLRGTIAMARTSDPNSATAQFFINIVDNGFLDYPGQDGYGYTVFGRVISGLGVVDRIAAVPTTSQDGAFQNLPSTPVVIEDAHLGNH